MATPRMAADALLTTITTSATTVTDLVQSIGTGAKMINDFASNAREQQLINIKLNRVGYVDILKRQKTIEIDQSRQILDDYIGNDQTKADRTKKIWEELEAALA